MFADGFGEQSFLIVFFFNFRFLYNELDCNLLLTLENRTFFC